jgi:hypothetical protein
VKKDLALLSRRRRVYAWLTFVALLAYTPIMGYLVNGPLALYTIPRDTWMLSVTVAGLVGFVLVVDDVERRRAARRAAAEPATPEN